MRHRLVQPVDPPPSAVTRFRFPSAVYLTALCRRLRYGSSSRGSQELFAECSDGVERGNHVKWFR